MKTNTELQIWFDDVLEVTWAYKNADCVMKNTMTGLRFRAGPSNADQVSTHYRYEIGDGLFLKKVKKGKFQTKFLDLKLYFGVLMH